MTRARPSSKRWQKAGHPVIRIVQKSLEHIGQEFFRFEIATAIAGAVIGINPFDQPDVEASKVKTRELTAAFEKSGALPAETPVCADKSIALYTDDTMPKALRKAGADGERRELAEGAFRPHRPGDYVAMLAYLARDEANAAPLQQPRARGARPAPCRDLSRIRAALFALDRPSLQRRTRQRRVPSDHLGRRRGSADPRPSREFRRGQGGAGARRFRRSASNAAGARCGFISTAIWRPALPRSRPQSNARLA